MLSMNSSILVRERLSPSSFPVDIETLAHNSNQQQLHHLVTFEVFVVVLCYFLKYTDRTRNRVISEYYFFEN